ncbi:unnamed protein product [Linum tenue]|uniref:Uncharacterized protein n=1 Tax=Linum tenue TaxID=586396 RepID=A0AAV0KWN8_9ROSI|nr:unnamed protein product [Linum tenue]
MDHRRCLPRT